MRLLQKKFCYHDDNPHDLPDSFRINYRGDRDTLTGSDVRKLIFFPSSLRGALRPRDEVAVFKPRDDLRGGDVPLMHPVQGVLRESVIALLGQMAHERDCLLCSQGLRRSAAPLIHVDQIAQGPIIFMGRL